MSECPKCHNRTLEHYCDAAQTVHCTSCGYTKQNEGYWLGKSGRVKDKGLKNNLFGLPCPKCSVKDDVVLMEFNHIDNEYVAYHYGNVCYFFRCPKCDIIVRIKGIFSEE